MAGPGAFYINGSVFPDAPYDRAVAGYGFSYERGVGEMLHNLGHRTEDTGGARVRRVEPGQPDDDLGQVHCQRVGKPSGVPVRRGDRPRAGQRVGSLRLRQQHRRAIDGARLAQLSEPVRRDEWL